jgi:hypothetical protein
VWLLGAIYKHLPETRKHNLASRHGRDARAKMISIRDVMMKQIMKRCFPKEKRIRARCARHSRSDILLKKRKVND